jgi:hypothetical protein
VELPAGNRPARVERPGPVLTDGSVLAREEAARLEPVGGVDRDVDDLRERRVRDLAVVALEVVLAADLPVRLVRGARAVQEAERLDVETRLGDEGGQVAERVRQGRRLGIGADEHERAPDVDLCRQQAELRAVEALLAVRPRRRAQ